MTFMRVILRDLTQLTDAEMGLALAEIGLCFPEEADNYTILVLEEAVRRYRAREAKANQ